MSNYNSTLQSNNTDLQAILNSINALPEAGGVELPELTNEGTAVDLAIGKQLIDSEGNVVTGTILHQNRTFAVAPVQDDNTYISSKYDAKYEKRIIGDGAYLKIRNRLSHFGDVSADEVMSGKTFTSTEGLKKTGTFSIDSELSTQDDLIAQIQAAVDNLPEAAGEGGGASIETCTVTVNIVGGIPAQHYCTTIFTEEDGILPGTNEVFGLFKPTIVENVVCGSGFYLMTGTPILAGHSVAGGASLIKCDSYGSHSHWFFSIPQKPTGDVVITIRDDD